MFFRLKVFVDFAVDFYILERAVEDNYDFSVNSPII